MFLKFLYFFEESQSSRTNRE